MASSSKNAWLIFYWLILGRLSSGLTPKTTACEKIKPCFCSERRVVCRNERLTRIPLGIPSDITVLDLSNNKLERIDVQRLSKLKSLKELILNNNNIRNIPPWDLLPTSLTLLSLHHNKIKAIPSFNTTKHHSLVRLFLNNNKLASLGNNAFTNLTKLQVLKLNKNKLTTVPSIALSGLISLTYLDLGKNKIQSILASAFRGPIHLKTLKLSKNRISRVQSSAFWGLNKLEKIYLDKNNFSTLQTSWFFGMSSLQDLFLQNNHISQIRTDIADWRSFPVLRKLNLANNKLSHINDFTFKHLLALRILNLARNHIYHITRGAFSDLHSLELLHLNDNDISWTVEEMDGPFNRLRNLLLLRLDGNRITSISSNAFLGLETLKYLNLSANIVTTVQENAFHVMKNLENLWLNTTHLMCDCKLKWLPIWLKAHHLPLHTINARCLHPQHLHLQSIFNVTAFICDTSNPVPQMFRHPVSKNALKGQNVTLRCKVQVFQKNDSIVRMSWRHDRDFVTTEGIINHAQTTDATMVTYSSELRLVKVDFNHAGFYQCIATNKFGSTTSKRAKLNILELPAFTKRPIDVTVQAGETIRLPCGATGDPKPTISWRKDRGNTKFSAAEEQRITHHESQDLFLITDSKAKDMGSYTCSATNDAGSINATAYVTVLQIPRFMQAMTSRTVEEGESAVLECMASGSPEPRFTWFKDMKKLSMNARVLTHLNGQLLVIVRVELDDEGTYTCEVSNTLGTARQTARLTVLLGSGTPFEEKEKETSAFRYDKKTFLGLIVVVVVSCVVGTSIVWLLVIYCARRGSHRRHKQEDIHSTAAPREDVSYIPLKSYSSGSTQTSRDSPRSTATFLTSTGSQGSTFPPCTSSSDNNSGSEKALTADNMSSETSVKGSHCSLASSCPSDESEPVRQVIHVQIHNSDSDSEKCRSISPARRKETSNTTSYGCGGPCGTPSRCSRGITNEISETENNGLLSELTDQYNTTHV